MSSLVTHESVHLAIGLVIGLAVIGVTRSWRAAAVAVAWSLLMDVDHMVDYFLARGASLDVSAMLSGTYFSESGQVYVPLHSWEIAGFLTALGWIKRASGQGAASLAIGLATFGHLAIDQIAYGMPPGTYFLFLRLLHGFSAPEAWTW